MSVCSSKAIRCVGNLFNEECTTKIYRDKEDIKIL